MLQRSGSTVKIQQRFVSAGVDGTLAGRFWVTGASAQSLALLTDHQGTTLAALNPNGTQAAGYLYKPLSAFGASDNPTASPSGSVAASSTGFTGASTPNATGGMVYLRNRWYDPATGRFLTQDPLGLAGGVNLYAYAGNDPISFSDPFGLCPDSLKSENDACYLWNQEQVAAAAKIAEEQLAKGNKYSLGDDGVERRGINKEDMERYCPEADPRGGCTVQVTDGKKTTRVYVINADRSAEAISGIIVHEREHERIGSPKGKCPREREAWYAATMAQIDPDAYARYANSPQARVIATGGTHSCQF